MLLAVELAARRRRPTITVKRTTGGYASNWIADQVAAGSVLEMLPPAGTFSPHSLDGDFLLFAGGSGITPVMSILKSALAQGQGRIVLVYANRDERSVIFGPELRRLQAAAGGPAGGGALARLAAGRADRRRDGGAAPRRTPAPTRSSAGQTPTWRSSGRR